VQDIETNVGRQNSDQHHRWKRQAYAGEGSRWLKRILTWRVDRFPLQAKLTPRQVDETVREAFRLWAKVTGLIFVHAAAGGGEPDISVRFYSYRHGDINVFDGPGGMLAHAYYPIFGGDVHIDDSENWTLHSYEVKLLFK
jgi:matrix metalloproteinase-14 (membrane-inserted)